MKTFKFRLLENSLMSTFNVIVECSGMREHHPAIFATVRLLTGVRSYVRFESVLFEKLFQTNVTLVFSFVRVHFHVYLELIKKKKLLIEKKKRSRTYS